jgi:hypothetical protein
MKIEEKIDLYLNEEKYVLTIITKKAIKDAKKRGIVSGNDIGKHFSLKSRSEAEKLKSKYKIDNEYNGDEIDSMFITPESEGLGQN